MNAPVENNLPATVYKRIVKERGLNDLDRALLLALAERGAWRAPITSNASELAAQLSYSRASVYAALRRLTAHHLVTHTRAGRYSSVYHAHLTTEAAS